MQFRNVSHKDISRMIEAGKLSKIHCVKNVPIFIRPGVVGEEITTLVQILPSKDSGYGFSLIEEVRHRVVDPNAIVVAQILGDRVNQYTLHDGMEEVKENYFKSLSQPENLPNLEQWNPKVTAEKVVYLVEENLEFPLPTSWGQEGMFRLMAGGVVVDNGDGCFYGINPLEFHATHSINEITPAQLQP